MRDAISLRRPVWSGAHPALPRARTVAAALQATARRLCRAWQARRARERAPRLHLALRELDARALRDIGFEPGEFGSPVAGFGNRADLDRMRAMQAA